MTSTIHDLRWRLREACAGAHARLDARLLPAFDSVAGYARFLVGMQAFHRQAQAALGAGPGMSALGEALHADLAVLGAAADDGAAAQAPVDAASATGWHYVIAGASLGARALLPRAAALGFDASRGARYLAAQAGDDAWRRFLAGLDRVPAADQAAACAGARAAFAAAESAMDAAFALEAA